MSDTQRQPRYPERTDTERLNFLLRECFYVKSGSYRSGLPYSRLCLRGDCADTEVITVDFPTLRARQLLDCAIAQQDEQEDTENETDEAL